MERLTGKEFLDFNLEPIKNCPDCKSDLTSGGNGVMCVFSADGKEVEIQSFIDNTGNIVPVNFNGEYIETNCKECHESIEEFRI